jgi:hypothetical protein
LTTKNLESKTMFMPTICTIQFIKLGFMRSLMVVYVSGYCNQGITPAIMTITLFQITLLLNHHNLILKTIDLGLLGLVI